MQTDRLTETKRQNTETQTDRNADRQTDRQADKHTDREKQMDRLTVKAPHVTFLMFSVLTKRFLHISCLISGVSSAGRCEL